MPGRIGVRAVVDGPVGAAERLWYDPQRWPNFIDGFGHVVKVEGDWPGIGARVVWDSTPAGRGRVNERVVEHEPGSGQALAVEDPRMRGTQRVTFVPVEGGTEVRLALEYQLKQANLLTPLVDMLFIRRALRDALRRTLTRFGNELAADRELFG
jgi:hypothetical protein